MTEQIYIIDQVPLDHPTIPQSGILSEKLRQKPLICPLAAQPDLPRYESPLVTPHGSLGAKSAQRKACDFRAYHYRSVSIALCNRIFHRLARSIKC